MDNRKTPQNNTCIGCPIDWEDVFGRIGDESIIGEFAAAFLKNSQALILALKNAVNTLGPEQVELYAHAMKGSASNMGAINLAKKAWQLEKAAADKTLADAGVLFAAIEEEHADLKAFLGHSDWMQQAKNAVTIKVP
ncbi:MAG: Hpt domain-containing protein [Planctomycetales bacterium]|nr:Hpt domain-containing protein [Planctomycetales bacterium]